MQTGTHEAQSSLLTLHQKSMKRKKQVNMSVLPLHNRKDIFRRGSTRGKNQAPRLLVEKRTIEEEKYLKHKTLPKLSTSFSQFKDSQKLPSKNIYESLSKTCLSLAVSTRNWCLFDSKKGEYFGFRQEHKRQIASLTKIMTTFLSISYIQKYDIPLSTLIRVTRTAAEMIGTSANLKENFWISLEDLLHGTMLPSGNDAAYSLAEYIGHLMMLKSKKSHSELQHLDLTKEDTNGYVQHFVHCMNKRASTLGLYNTKFSNPHGLQNALSTSSAKDIVKLSIEASKNQLFRTIMNTFYYKYEVFEGEKIRPFELKRWWNTNKLLLKEWEGIKTGITPSAGSCLSSLKEGIYITVLNCSNAESRFTDTEKIFSWYKTYLGQSYVQKTANTSFEAYQRSECKDYGNQKTEVSL